MTQIGYVNDLGEGYVDDYVVQTLHFDRERLTNGLHPLVNESAYARANDKVALLQNLINEFFQTYYSVRKKTILLPTTEDILDVVVDPFLTDFLLKIIERDMLPANLTTFELTDWNANRIFFTVFDALISRNVAYVSSSVKYMVFQNTFILSNSWVRNFATASGIDSFLYPEIMTNDLDGEVTLGFPAEEEWLESISPYVFSQSFYEGNIDFMDPYETVVYNYLDHKPVQYNDVLFLIEQKTNNSVLRNFYYLPILIFLLKVCE
jgi:hypothetical protein